MNIISLCGLFPFLIYSVCYKSHGSFIIYVNGIFFHMFPNNKILYTIDFSTNAFLFMYSTLKYSFVFKYMMFSFIFFLLNLYYFKNNKYICEINHVVFVQYIGLYALSRVHEVNKCFPLLFYCR